jgi:hypothetical protein
VKDILQNLTVYIILVVLDTNLPCVDPLLSSGQFGLTFSWPHPFWQHSQRPEGDILPLLPANHSRQMSVMITLFSTIRETRPRRDGPFYFKLINKLRNYQNIYYLLYTHDNIVDKK